MIAIQKFHLYYLKVYACVKISVECFENFGGGMPQMPPPPGCAPGPIGVRRTPNQSDFSR